MRLSRPSLLAAALLCGPVEAAQQAPDLTQLSLAELADVEVTSLSRRRQPVEDTAAAVHVVPGSEVTASGATSLAEGVRLAPGVTAARIDASRWAVGVRGFASRLARSTLVLVDGRSVYNPLFAGTYWESLDLLLADVDRIEVVRGPGGALWGANAVNGVINVITRSAAQTHGGVLGGRLGTQERAAIARWGQPLGEADHVRAWGKGTWRSGEDNATRPGFDEWWSARAGLRFDHEPREGAAFMLDAGVFTSEIGEVVGVSFYDPPRADVLAGDLRERGGHALARWRRPSGERSELEVQASWDRTDRDELHFDEVRDTLDLQLVQRLSPGRHQVVFGAGYRRSAGDSEGLETVLFEPEDRTDHIVSAFAQYERALHGERVRLSAGLKAERNDYSGLELQPNLRGLVRVGARHRLWASVSRAVRTPSRTERDLQLAYLRDPAIPAFARISGNDDFMSESVVAWEAGWRVDLFGHRAWLDTAAFYNRYSDLLSVESGTPFAEAGRLVVPLRLDNLLDGRTWGLETSLTGHVSRLGFEGSWAWLRMDLETAPGSNDTTSVAAEGQTPRHQLQLRTWAQVHRRFTVSALLRHATGLPAFDVDGSSELDLRAAWKARRLELALVGKNLLHGEHVEFAGGTEGRTAIERAVFAQATLSW